MNTTSSSARRYPVDAKGIGLIQHGRQKTYMMSVLWSDSNNIIIYRTFEEFKKLHKDLKRRLPIEAGWFKKSERVLPTLRDAPLFLRARDSNRYMERLKLLEVYSRELLQTDPKVSQCEDVTQFYMPQKRDLDPSFHDNSIVILPSDAGDGKKENPVLQTEAPVTERIKSDQYECVEAFETKDTKNRPFKVKKGDFLEVLLKDTTGWWLAENEEKRLAWFPAPFLRKTGPAEKFDPGRQSQHGGVLYFATKGYEAKSSDEVSVDIGVIVEVVEKSDNGWWLVWYNGRAGYIPSMYLKTYSNPHQRFQVAQNQGIYTSTPDLVKTSSSTLNAAASPNQKTSEEDPLQETAAKKRQMEKKAALNRRKSRSLSVLPISEVQTYQPKVALEMDRLQGGPSVASGHSPDANRKPIPRPRKVLLDQHLESGPLSETAGATLTRTPARRRLHREFNEQGNNSSFDDSSSISDSDTQQPSSDADSDSVTPAVPPRPRMDEILKNCTTVTKKAVQKTERQRVVW